MSINTYAINTRKINSFESDAPIIGTVVTKGVGNLLTIENKVVITGVGNLISIEQEIFLRITGVGNLLTIENKVRNVGVGNLLTIENFVFTEYEYSYIASAGFYPMIIINGYRIPDNQICEMFQITRGENESAQASFTLATPLGPQNYYEYEGKPIQFKILKQDGTIATLYTGIVNTPTVDFVAKRTYYTCSDLRREQIINQLAAEVPYIGWYLEEIFGEAEDLEDELTKRLTTTLTNVDFNAQGQYIISDYLPKNSPDFTIVSSQLYREKGKYPKIALADRSRILNKVNIDFTYQYTRLYQREVSFSWSAAYPSICDFLQQGYSILQKNTLYSAIENAGWPLRTIGFTPVLAGGYYYCDGAYIGFVNGTFSGGDVQRKKDSAGDSVTDASGNAIQETVTPGQNISSVNLCFGAQWIAATRFTQNIQEKYTLSVSASQSIAKYGTIEQNDTIGINAPYDTEQWETFPSYSNAPSGAATAGVDKYIDADTDRVKFNQAFNIAVQRAKTSIIKSHRQNTVLFTMPINSDVELNHTVELDCELSIAGGSLNTIGKVTKIVHNIDIINPKFSTTQITIANSKSYGSASNSALVAPAKPTYNYTSPQTAISLGSIYGQLPPNNFMGFSGNKFKVTKTGYSTGIVQDYARTTFTETFIVRVPAIEDAVRNTKDLFVSASYNVLIPDYLLNVVY